MLEVAKFYVRPKTHDKQRHVFLVLFDSDTESFSEVTECFLAKMNEVFPFGYWLNSKSRHVLDYLFSVDDFCSDSSSVERASCLVRNFGVNHDYLAQYLSSSTSQ